MKRFLVYIMMVCWIVVAPACKKIAASDYNPDECTRIMQKALNARQLADIGRSDWHLIYTQYIAMSLALDTRLDSIIHTPWTDEKERACEQIFSGELMAQRDQFAQFTQPLTIPDFPPSEYFTKKEIDYLVQITGECSEKIAWLRAQADM